VWVGVGGWGGEGVAGGLPCGGKHIIIGAIVAGAAVAGVRDATGVLLTASYRKKRTRSFRQISEIS